MNAEAVGYLLPHLAVLAQAVVGDWAKVRYHKKRAVPLSTQASSAGQAVPPGGGLRGDGWGWCLIRDPVNADRTFLRSTTMTNASPLPPQAPPAQSAAVTNDKNTASATTAAASTAAGGGRHNSNNSHAFNDSNDEVEEDEETRGDNEMNVSQVGRQPAV